MKCLADTGRGRARSFSQCPYNLPKGKRIGNRTHPKATELSGSSGRVENGPVALLRYDGKIYSHFLNF